MIRKRDGGVRVWEEMRVGIYKRRRFPVMNRSSGQFEAKSSVEKQEAAYNWMTDLVGKGTTISNRVTPASRGTMELITRGTIQ